MTVAEWMRDTYKAERFRNEPGFHSDREQRLIADRENDVATQGYALISHHDSITGRIELYGQPPQWFSDACQGDKGITRDPVNGWAIRND